jgi:hypothetical protein
VLEADGKCRGCLRTLDEIARWSGMSPDEQRALIAELQRRRELRGGMNAKREV